MGILKGTFPALLTPYNEDLSINEKEFMRYCEFGLTKGLDGLFCNGSAGDSQALGLKEQITLMKLCKSVSKNHAPVITGISSTIYENTFILANEAHKLGLDALLLAMPYYYKFDEDTLFEYVKNIASKVKLPLYLYNIPLFAPPLSLKLTQRLAELDNVVGLKDSSGDALHLSHLLDLVPQDFDIFVGREEFYAGALMAGAKGSMTAIAGVFPELMSAIYKLSKQENFKEAMKLQKSILKCIRFAMSFTFPMGFALLLKARGFNFANKSLHPLSPSSLKALEQGLDEAKSLIKSLEKESGISL
ncbi:dihydrodipicolinate synthase family protein [Campylobacter sp. MIT 12-5580]|uniref:dihydrodipicolinate synthase family protein n=1 Tax=Campylobacter sp. MIT 12-5580 TaxID=2040651 RepID=UPI0010F56D5C|nr:dihydrodipicolinate synthase family protein [Campylobacter sp. MIT 12-5580]TKX29427.1 dihydrodipicolinate synthase family protein [Campylobacter sp. MIT 12-5580]